MKRALKIIGGIIAIFIVVIAFLMSNTQLATTINWILPKEWKVQLPQGINLGWQGSSLSQFKLSYQGCPLVSVDNTALTWVARSRLSIDSVTIDYECLSLFPQTERGDSHTSLDALLAVIPDGEVIIYKLHWLNLPNTLNLRAKKLLEQPTKLRLSLLKGQVEASLQQQAVEFLLNFANSQLKLELAYKPSEKEEHLATLSAKINDNFMQLPPRVLAKYQWQLSEEIVSDKRLQRGTSTIKWQSLEDSLFEGDWQLYLTDSPKDKFNIPFTFDGKSLEIKQGRFDWSLTKAFPFHGFVNAKFTPKSIEQNGFFPLKTALRFSLLSQNEWGKGNIVISNEEGEITANSLNLPLRLTGNIKHGNFILYSSIPLDFQGEFDDLTLKFLPSSLFRITGKERYLTIEDLRFPLAGIRVDKYGVHGRLQAILKGESPDFKKINFHLDGYAHNFKIGTSGLFQKAVTEDVIEDSWKWRIWGNSILKGLNSKINLSGRGQWHANNIWLTEFIGDLSEVKLEGTTIPEIELALNEIIKFDTQKLTLNGKVSLKSPEIKFSYGGILPKPEAKLAFNGNVENLNFKGIINTTELGPLRLFARRQLTSEASQIIGKLYWPEQSANGFQPLFPFRSQWVIKQGTIRGETAFSAGIKNGFIAGGHLAIRNGGISLPNGEVRGIEFSLPYRYQNGRFNFGAKQPITVNIAQIKLGDLVLDNATMKIDGHYPYTKSKPLNLNELSFSLLGGKLNIKRFALPQTQLAYLNLEKIDFEKILEFLQYQQIQIEGKANATFPFWLSGEPCYICDGLLVQAQTSSLAFTPDLLKAMAKSGYTEQILLRLVDKSTITDFRSLINVSSTGDLVFNGKLALQANEGQSKVNLNYNHQENMFDLWKLINYGSQFEQKLENKLYQKLE